MCGFVGCINLDPGRAVDRSVLEAMNDTLAHRGPDDAGYFLDRNVGLAHRRLSIIDITASGRQPLGNEDGSVQVVLNGEIYNYRALRDDLRARGHVFTTETDTEAVVHAYEEWGADCVARLDGMFALAVYDLRASRLLLAKDPFGKKPLYYTLQNGVFLFGSEPKAFFPHPAFEKRLDLPVLQQYLAHDFVPTPSCIFEGCYKLLRGCYAVLDTQSINAPPVPQSYWQPVYEPKQDITLEDAAAEYIRLLRDAVKKRLMSDVPLGVFLSGGLDSSTLVALMADLLPPSAIRTFTIGFSERSFDESPHARLVAEHFGTEHHDKILDPAGMLAILPRIVSLLDEPFADASIIPTSLLCQFARENVTVALGGDGGDELLAGYHTFVALKLARLVDWIPGGLLSCVGRSYRMIPLSDSDMNMRYKAKHFVKGFASDIGRHVALRNAVWVGSFRPDIQASLLQSSSESWQTLYQHDLAAASAAGAVAPVDRLVSAYVNGYLHDDILVKVDRASMLHSLEVRAPFLDRDLAAFVNTLPPSIRMPGLRKKNLLKVAADKLLPKKILQRGKKGFSIPLGAWLRGPLREMMGDLLAPDRLRRGGVFNPVYVQNLMKQHLARKEDNRKELWCLLMLELWRQTHGVD